MRTTQNAAYGLGALLIGGCYNPQFPPISDSDSLTENHVANEGIESEDQNSICGDGKIALDEECDDSNTFDFDSCLSDCTRAKCGDGIVQLGYEECDDGNQSNNDSCLNTCKEAQCGDGFVWAPQEECDQGANNAPYGNNRCTSTCQIAPSCGNGILDFIFGEECDDGNQSNNDSCLNTCKEAQCGDGFVWAPQEECDQGNNNNDTAYGHNSCTTMCSRGPYCGNGIIDAEFEDCDDSASEDNLCVNCKHMYRYVFVTEAVYNGKLGDVSSADAICKETALANDLGNEDSNWIAWISTNLSSAESRYMNKTFTGLYILPGEPMVFVANGWKGLTSGWLISPISKTETGVSLLSGTAWTSTASNGDFNALGEHCSKWLASDGTSKGRLGDITAYNSKWSDKGETSACNTLHHLYCIQD